MAFGSSDLLMAFQDDRADGERVVLYRTSMSTTSYVSTWSVNVDILPSSMYLYDSTYISIVGTSSAGDKLRFLRVCCNQLIMYRCHLQAFRFIDSRSLMYLK